MKFWRKSLLVRLLTFFLLLTIIPLSIVGVVFYFQSQNILRQNIGSHLTTTAILKEEEINRWLGAMEQDVRLLAANPVLRTAALSLLTSDDPATSDAYRTLRSYLNNVLAEKHDFSEVLVLRGVGGEVVLSTNRDHEGEYEVTSSFFTEGRKRTYLQNVYPSASLGKLAMTVSTPLADESGKMLGVLAVHLDLEQLDAIMLERGSLGATGETYLVDQFNNFVSEARFGHSNFPRGVHTNGIDAALMSKKDGVGIYENYQGVRVMGAYRWLDDRDMALLAEIELKGAMRPMLQLTLIVHGVLLGVALAASLVAYLVSKQITRPILEMAETSSKMADGDLGQSVGVRREDEIGILAESFNRMAARLRDLIAGLEQRVADRTRELENRASQFATAAEMGRATTSILELEALGRRVVELMRERFDLYYAGLFLLDSAGQYAVLSAGTGEAGRLMKEQEHRLEVGGQSMVGAACARREARIAMDVGEEPIRFDNPLLPDTRSEVALPLLVGDRVLGALDVQSTRAAAFSTEDIAVLQLVADQVAVAVNNALRFSEEAALLEAASPLFRISRGLTKATTTDEVVEAILSSVIDTDADGCKVARYNLTPGGDIESIRFLAGWQRHGSAPFPLNVALPPAAFPFPLIKGLLLTEDVAHETSLPEEFRQRLARMGAASLVVFPLRVGERAIGFLAIDRSNPGPFSPVSLRLYEILADQAAVALERSRLLEESQQQAWREHVVRGIADKVTLSFDLDTVLQTTLEELGSLVGATGGYAEMGTAEHEMGQAASGRRPAAQN